MNSKTITSRLYSKTKTKVFVLRFDVKTKMHSSGMRTAHLLTVSQHALHGVSAKGVSARTGVCPGGCLPRGVCSGADTPLWTDGHL